MKQTFNFSLESAFEAEKNSQLFQWTQDYLRSEGNNSGLADHLLNEDPSLIILKEFPLKKLKRIMGPESGMNFSEEFEVWELRVNSLVQVVKDGTTFPPLIVTDFWEPLTLSDGSHRHESMIRLGIEEYWTLFFFKSLESIKLIENN